MKLLEVVLIRKGDSFYNLVGRKSEESERWCSCDLLKFLYRFFNIPATLEPKKIWLSLHNTEAKNRENFVVKKYIGPYASYPMLTKGKYTIDNEKIDELLNPFVGKKVWLQMEYEE